ncbi:MAG: hypothetical protein EAX96_06150 [Candidatus Lokiarchaeota archaeon]|nr:hypothetical protein [Candidatus Lokiarchaeota archaeon]
MVKLIKKEILIYLVSIGNAFQLVGFVIMFQTFISAYFNGNVWMIRINTYGEANIELFLFFLGIIFVIINIPGNYYIYNEFLRENNEFIVFQYFTLQENEKEI